MPSLTSARAYLETRHAFHSGTRMLARIAVLFPGPPIDMYAHVRAGIISTDAGLRALLIWVGLLAAVLIFGVAWLAATSEGCGNWMTSSVNRRSSDSLRRMNSGNVTRELGTRYDTVVVTAAAFVTVALGVVSAQAPASSSVLTNVDIQKILVERVDTKRQSAGIVVGLIEPAGRRIVAHGSLARGDARVLDGDTVFEIGSITKVFTSLLLANAVQC